MFQAIISAQKKFTLFFHPQFFLSEARRNTMLPSILVSHFNCEFQLMSLQTVVPWKLESGTLVLGQRLVFYLALSDVMMNIVHFVDHLFWVLRIRTGFEQFCVFAAFLLNVGFSIEVCVVWILVTWFFKPVHFCPDRLENLKWDFSTTGFEQVLGCFSQNPNKCCSWGFWCQTEWPLEIFNQSELFCGI